MSDPPLIGPVSDERRAEVLSLVFRHLLVEDREQRVRMLLKQGRSGVVSLAGLLAARRGGRLVGGILAEIQVGRTAVVWPPCLVPDEPPSTAERLLATASEFLAREGICVAHALLDPGMTEDETLLRAGGFQPLANLLYLVCLEDHFPPSRPTSRLEFESYSPANHGRMARLIEATYVETLDCPRLNDVRQIDDILAGYRATGGFDPDRWLLVGHQGEDVGCLLLADHPERENCELVYMGLAPAARGSGRGKEITRHAQWLTRQSGRPRLVLAVDEANVPAIRAYSTLGFHSWNRKAVHLKIFSAS
jgi:ribosomal protein S18 acetylase RimI-like enzyme